MRKAIIAISATVATVVLLLVFAPLYMPVALLIGHSGAGGDGGQSQDCGTTSVVIADPQLKPDQLAAAKIIIGTTGLLGHAAGLSVGDTIKAEVISVVTSYGESGLRNVKHGDAAGPDSYGYFQQRTAWGPLTSRGNPGLATGLFLTVNKGPGVIGLFNTAGWQRMSVTQAAHAVQHNSDPNYYAQFQQMATRLVAQANGGSVASAMLSIGCPPAAAPGAGLQKPPNIGGPGVDGYYTMPPSLDGSLHTYSCQAHRTGSLEQISVLYTVAQRWKATYPKGWINLGDMNAAGHLSHKWGVAADIEATTNGTDKVADFTHGNYNRAATIELGKMFVDTGKLKSIWYNDVAVDRAVIAYARSKHLPLEQMMPQSGHEDHFHTNTNGPRGRQYEPGC